MNVAPAGDVPNSVDPMRVSMEMPVPVRSSGAQEQGEMQLGAYDNGETFMGTCPDCGSQLEYAEGCVKCHVCGFSECG